MSVVSEALYNYCYNPCAMTSPFNPENWKKRLIAAEKVYNMARELNLWNIYSEELLYCLIKAVYLCNLEEFESHKYYESFPIDKLKSTHEFLKTIDSNYINNKYFRSCKWNNSLRAVKIVESIVKDEAVLKDFFEYETIENDKKVIGLLHRLEGKSIAIWGAGKKGKEFLNQYDDKNEKIRYVIDKNTEKQHTRLETGHEIVGFDEVTGCVDAILVMNYRHFESVKEQVKAIQGDIELINYENWLYAEEDI